MRTSITTRKQPPPIAVSTELERDAQAAFSPSNCSASLPPVLDACCGSRMLWFDAQDKRALFMDARAGEYPIPNDRPTIVVRPDLVADFINMPFPNESFHLVVFDPPHHTSTHFGTKHVSIMQSSYGVLLPAWEEMIAAGFAECFRVLKTNGTLIFKWGSSEIPRARVLSLTPHKPLFGHTTNSKATTHWVAYMKRNAPGEPLARENQKL